MKLFDNHGALTLTKKKLIILLGVVLGVALITWGVLMVSIFHKGKAKNKDRKVPAGYKEVYLLTKRTDLDDVGGVYKCWKYEYDDRGRLVRESEDEYWNDDISSDVCTYEYDENGRQKQKTCEHYLNDEKCSWQIWEYEYNSEGLVAAKTYTEDRNGFGNSYTRRNVYSYNQKGIKVRETFSAPEFTEDFFYNDDGNLLREMYYTPSGIEVPVKECTYSEDGLILTEYEYRDDGLREICDRTIYEYDASGTLINKQYYKNEKPTVTVTCPEPGKRMTYMYKYENEYDENPHKYLSTEEWLDEQENVLKCIRYDGSGEFYGIVEYEYSEQSLKAKTYAKKVAIDGNGKVMYETNREFYVKPDNSVSILKETFYHPETGEETGYYYTLTNNGYPSTLIEISSDGNTYVDEKWEYTRFVVPITE